MNNQNTKNVIILKNLPSNLIDEAIIVVKDKKKVKDINYSDLLKYKEKNEIVQSSMKQEELKKIENIKRENRIVKSIILAWFLWELDVRKEYNF